MEQSVIFRLLTYYPLFNVGIGLLGNTSAFLIFRLHAEFSSSSSMVYLSFISITDTLALFGWQLDRYLIYNQFVSIFTINKIVCKVATFNQFVSLQSSALLMSAMSVDRYVHVSSQPGSRFSRMPFRTAKSAFGWSLLVILLVALVNSHILVFGCAYLSNQNKTNATSLADTVLQDLGTIAQYPTGFYLYYTWRQIHLVLYILVPFLIMATSNLLVINKIIGTKVTKYGVVSSTVLWNKMSNTILVFILNVVFVILVLPANIEFAFESQSNNYILKNLLDSVAFTNHASLFITCFLSHSKFRRSVRKIFKICF